jgi:hypothetical protein
MATAEDASNPHTPNFAAMTAFFISNKKNPGLKTNPSFIYGAQVE